MLHPWPDSEMLDAVGGREGRAAVLDRPDPGLPETMLAPFPFAPACEHSRETVVAFPGTRRLDQTTRAFLSGVVTDFVEDAPRHGYRDLVLACDAHSPFRPLVERLVHDIASQTECQVQFTTEPRRVDLFVVLKRAVGRSNDMLENLVWRLLAQEAAEVLVVAPDDEPGEQFVWKLSWFLAAQGCEAYAEFIQSPPEPGCDLRICDRMFHILTREATV